MEVYVEMHVSDMAIVYQPRGGQIDVVTMSEKRREHAFDRTLKERLLDRFPEDTVYVLKDLHEKGNYGLTQADRDAFLLNALQEAGARTELSPEKEEMRSGNIEEMLSEVDTATS